MCGVLDRNIDDLAIIVPNVAVRDEGTSYHYAKASREIEVNEKYKDIFEEIIKENNISYIEGKVWTTDAPYRETRNKEPDNIYQLNLSNEKELNPYGGLVLKKKKM